MENLVTINDRDMFVAYIMVKAKGNAGFTKDAVGKVYDQIVSGLKIDPKQMNWVTSQRMQLGRIREELHNLYNSKQFPKDQTKLIKDYVDDVAEKVGVLTTEKVQVGATKTGKPKYAAKAKAGWESYQQFRQDSLDEATKWYNKEFTDYTQGNIFDAMMRNIYPFWPYESQRLTWLPRSFLRHPGTFTAFERWQDNSDEGYFQIPGTPLQANILRGTVYGLLSKTVKRDYSNYYDEIPGGQVVRTFDFLSNYGFFPSAMIGVPLAIWGGAEQQMGETLPAIWKTPLSLMQAALPGDKSVQWLTDHIFHDRFKDYMTNIEATRLGGDGLRIYTKIKNGEKLTPEEEALWTDARRMVGWYSMLFEQTGLFRLRPQEQTRAREEAGKLIEKRTGITVEQQDEYHKHGINIWDLLGGMSPTIQAQLQELDNYRWVGLVRPLLPGKQQDVYNKLDADWADIEAYNLGKKDAILQLERDFLSGAISANDYSSGMSGIYDDQRKYMAEKEKENPLLTLEGRATYLKENGVVPPVLHPFKELLNLYFSTELHDKIEDDTGAKVEDWDRYFAEKDAIALAVPDQYKQEWDDYLSRNATPLMTIRREVTKTYFNKYDGLWEQLLSRYSEDEQRLIKEYLFLEDRNQNFPRQEEIKLITDKQGRQLVSGFRTDVSNAKKALRYANPALDAWLNYWGRVSSFTTPQAYELYQRYSLSTGKKL